MLGDNSLVCFYHTELLKRGEGFTSQLADPNRRARLYGRKQEDEALVKGGGEVSGAESHLHGDGKDHGRDNEGGGTL